MFEACKFVHHHTIQINHHLDATIYPVYYTDVYLQTQHVSDILTPIIKTSTTAVTASGFTFGT
jgi:isopentenyl phosphate kinase